MQQQQHGALDTRPEPHACDEGLAHGVHAALFARDSAYNLPPSHERVTRATVLMCLRFDGTFGFPGGFVDPGESLEEGVNREVFEEVGAVDPPLSREDYVGWYLVQHGGKGKLILHFYAREVREEQLDSIIRGAGAAKHFGEETLGVCRVPVYLLGKGRRKGFPAFLSNQFAGSAREQLLWVVKQHELLPEADFAHSLDASGLTYSGEYPPRKC